MCVVASRAQEKVGIIWDDRLGVSGDSDCAATSMATSVSSQRFDDDSQSYEVVFDGIDAIVESMNREIDDKWLGSLEVPMATDQAMLKISKLIAWAIMAHDGSVDPTNPGKTLEYLVPDKELPLPPIDTWARGTVPVRKLEEPHSDFKVNKENQDGEKTPSVSSFRTSNSGTAKTSNSKTSYMSKASKARGAQKEEELDPTGQIVELDDPDEEFGDLDGNGELFQTLNRLVRLLFLFLSLLFTTFSPNPNPAPPQNNRKRKSLPQTSSASRQRTSLRSCRRKSTSSWPT